MRETGAPLDKTHFTIDLIACQAASRNGKQLSFAERLVKELSELGISQARVIASPTIMEVTDDGSEANLSKEADRKRRDGGFNIYNFFSLPSFSADKPALLEPKVIFRSGPAGNVVRNG